MSDTLQDTFNKIIAHREAGRLDEAHRLLDMLIAEKGDMPRLLQQKGLVLFASGQVEDGLAKLREATAAAPQDPIIMLDLAVVLAQLGQLDEALPLMQTAVDLAPEFGPAHANLGAALAVKERYQLAARHLEKAVHLNPSNIDALLNLARSYQRDRSFKEAIDTFFKVLALDARNVSAHVGLAGALHAAERHDAAEHHAKRALELDDSAYEARLSLAQTLSSAGRIDEAVELLIQVMQMRGLALVGLLQLLPLRKVKPGSIELDALEQALAQIDRIDGEGKTALLYAAGKAFDDLGEADRAWGYLTEANEGSKGVTPFDLSLVRGRYERLMKLGAPEIVGKLTGKGVDQVAPIFICGMPRSGTTLTEQFFSRHPKVTAGGELPSAPTAIQAVPALHAYATGEASADGLTAQHIYDFGAAYVDHIRSLGLRQEITTDKMPANYQHAGLIHMAFPRARILFLRRHPLDCILSNYLQNFGKNQPMSTSIKNLAATYRLFDETTAFWTKTLDDRVRTLVYEDLVADPETEMRALLDWADLSWDDDVLDQNKVGFAVNTASVSQVRQSVYQSSSGKWKRYAKHFSGVVDDLAGLISEEDRDLILSDQT